MMVSILVVLPFVLIPGATSGLWNTPASELQKWYPNHYLALFRYLYAVKIAVAICILIPLVYVVYASLAERKYTELLLAAASLIISLFAAEAVLRKAGYRPLYLKVSGQSVVDSLVVYNGFKCYEDGVYRIDTAVYDALKSRNYHAVGPIDGSLWEAIRYFDATSTHPEISDLGQLAQSIAQKRARDEWEDEILHYMSFPYNEQGFFSISFGKNYSGRRRVLLLGDSFTWGFTASNFSQSFANNLLARGYAVYNTGIGGTDVTQYLQVAKKYIPMLKPEAVVVNLYLGNDISHYGRRPLPNTPLLYHTNGGMVFNTFYGDYMNNPAQCYEIVKQHLRVLPEEKRLPYVLFNTSVLGTLMWKVFAVERYRAPMVDSMAQKAVTNYQKVPACLYELKEIQQICADNNSRFILSVIPSIGTEYAIMAKNFPDVLDSFNYYEPKLSIQDYCGPGDEHLNTTGHKDYANHLLKLLNGR
jgi:lysophospholipase L1-like esterase